MLRFLTSCLIALTLSSCATARKSDTLPDRCGRTPVNLNDLERFGFQPSGRKTVIVRLFRGSCPFCKEDLQRLGEMFKQKEWNPVDVQIFLIAYFKEGVENRQSFDKFVREQFSSFQIPLEATQIIYIDKTYQELVRTTNAAGKTLFEGWRAVPYGMIFASDGRLAYRGHFTQTQASQQAQYKLISKLQKETCPPPSPLP